MAKESTQKLNAIVEEVLAELEIHPPVAMADAAEFAEFNRMIDHPEQFPELNSASLRKSADDVTRKLHAKFPWLGAAETPPSGVDGANGIRDD